MFVYGPNTGYPAKIARTDFWNITRLSSPMNGIALTLSTLGMCGLVVSTVAGPLAVGLCAIPTIIKRRSLRSDSLRSQSDTSQNVAVVIPVFNDAQLLGRTLSSLESVRRHESGARSVVKTMRVVVVADGCSDDSCDVARSYGVELIENVTNIGKWGSLEKGASYLTSSSGSEKETPDWIAFVDCGVEWNENFLSDIALELTDPSLSGIAPTYRDENAGLIARLMWRFESALKALESLGRGPVSVHGATVLYRAAPLEQAFQRLEGTRWLNDDVVLPIMVRSLSYAHKIKYLPGVGITDRSPRVASRAVAQRKRMMSGNLQWLCKLWPMVCVRDAGTGFVALRRVARIFWAYWVAFIAVGFAVLILDGIGMSPFEIAVHPIGSVGILFVIFCSMMAVMSKTSPSARASLLAPVGILSMLNFLSGSNTSRSIQWR